MQTATCAPRHAALSSGTSKEERALSILAVSLLQRGRGLAAAAERLSLAGLLSISLITLISLGTGCGPPF